jgi:hypothetical protein
MTLLRDEIISLAFKRIRVGVHGEPLQAGDVEFAAKLLNGMIAQWATDGLQMWRKTDGTLFLKTGQRSYQLGPTGVDHVTAAFVETTLAADAAESATEIEVASAAGIADGDTIGILIGADFEWTTVDGAPAGTTVTIADALSADADEGAVVVAYTDKIGRPLRILDARRRDTNGHEIPVDVVSRPDYLELPHKDAAGLITQVHYDKQLANGALNVWPVSSGTERLLFTFARPIASLDGIEDAPDFPGEWNVTLWLNLALMLAPTYSFPLDERAELRTEAMLAKAVVEGADREDGPIFFQPDLSRM